MSDSNDPNKSKKRRFRDPETFRERVLKSNEDNDIPKVDTPKTTSAVSKGSSKVFGPIAKSFGKLKSIKSLKPVFKVLSIIGRILLPKYFRTSFQELKQVTWPSLKQSLRLTYAVVIFAVIFGASIAVIDFGLGKVFKHLLLK